MASLLFTALALASLLAALPTTAFAQEAAPAPAPPPAPAPISFAPAIASFAHCLATARPAEADAYLAMAPGSPGEPAAFDALLPPADAACEAAAPALADRQTPIPVMFLRGGLAETRYAARYPEAAPAAIAQARAMTMSEDELRARITAAADPTLEVTRVFGDCVVAAWAPGVDYLIRTTAGSAEETAAIGALQASLASCLPSGRTASFSRESLRPALADALYRKSEGLAAPVTSRTEPVEGEGR